MNFLTTTEMSKVWGISSRRISLLCAQDRVEGAFKKGKTWLIPEGTKKPGDPRSKLKNCEKPKEKKWNIH
ncbi:MAG: DNA-binding protein [Clostridia bacterium]|nr:DNA-binding protein [Clostridia bacterium]